MLHMLQPAVTVDVIQGGSKICSTMMQHLVNGRWPGSRTPCMVVLQTGPNNMEWRRPFNPFYNGEKLVALEMEVAIIKLKCSEKARMCLR